MKFMSTNYSGNVGKSMVARHLLSPRLNNCPVIPVESINSDGTETEALRGNQYSIVAKLALLEDDLVVDVGASNVELFLEGMRSQAGGHEDFDVYVVPVVGQTKQIKDTISTVEALAELGVPAEKIRIIFNQVRNIDDIEQVFGAIYRYAADEGKCIISPDAAIYWSDLFPMLRGGDVTVTSILADTTDYKAALKAETDPGARQALADKIIQRRLAAGVAANLDRVFAALLAPVQQAAGRRAGGRR